MAGGGLRHVPGGDTARALSAAADGAGASGRATQRRASHTTALACLGRAPGCAHHGPRVTRRNREFAPDWPFLYVCTVVRDLRCGCGSLTNTALTSWRGAPTAIIVATVTSTHGDSRLRASGSRV